MRILGHIHTFNDNDVIDQTLAALVDQTYALEEILLVDNASTDGTLNRTFAKQVTVIRHSENLGTSGAVITGFQYALEKGYDWIWLFDADSVPRRNALEALVTLYESFSVALQEQTRLLACLPVLAWSGTPLHGIVITQAGLQEASRDAAQPFYECDIAIWSGSLYKVATIQKIGLPSADYVLDAGECEYGYRGKRCGYRAFMHQGSLLDHDVGSPPRIQSYRVGPVTFQMINFTPIRCYYLVRNWLYFWLYEHEDRTLWCLVNETSWLIKYIGKLMCLARWAELAASVRGFHDGIWKNVQGRY